MRQEESRSGNDSRRSRCEGSSGVGSVGNAACEKYRAVSPCKRECSRQDLVSQLRAREMATGLAALRNEAVGTPPVHRGAGLRLGADHGEGHDACFAKPVEEVGVAAERYDDHVDPVLDADLDVPGVDERHQQIDRNGAAGCLLPHLVDARGQGRWRTRPNRP